MSEHDNFSFGWKLILVMLLLWSMFMTVIAQFHVNWIQDLQRRVAELEQRK